MLSAVVRSRIGFRGLFRIASSSPVRFWGTESNNTIKDQTGHTDDTKNNLRKEGKQESKEKVELPDTPDFPDIQMDYKEGTRSRDYLNTVPREKRADLLSKKPGSIVYFDDEEFKYFFPHEWESFLLLLLSFFLGFEKQKGLTKMNTLHVRKEAQKIMEKLKSLLLYLVWVLEFQEGETIDFYPFLCLTGPRGSGKS